MCLILFAYQTHIKYPLIVAANRDEDYLRPTAQACFWKDSPTILAGRDLEKKGTWMGVNRTGLFAAVTNYRDTSTINSTARSRGELVSQYLANNLEPEEYLLKIRKRKDNYNGFNLLAGHVQNLCYYSNIENKISKVAPGVYGLSNALLNTSWPKVVKGKEMLTDCLHQESLAVDDLFSILADAEPFADGLLPDTGVGKELERTLSSLFISSSNYGTRSSTVILIEQHGLLSFTERTFHPGDNSNWNEVAYTLQV